MSDASIQIPPHEKSSPFRTAMLIVAVWLFLVGSSYMASLLVGRSVPLCLFRRVTGYPCPGCGGTRSLVSLLGLSLSNAWFFNPLATVFFFAAPLWVLIRYGVRRRPFPPMPTTTRRACVLIVLAALGVNWWYVIAHQREIDARPPPRFERFFAPWPAAHTPATGE